MLALLLFKSEKMEREAGAVEISHTVSVKFDGGKFVPIPSNLLVQERNSRGQKTCLMVVLRGALGNLYVSAHWVPAG